MSYQKTLGYAPRFTSAGKPINSGFTVNGTPTTPIALESFKELDVTLADDFPAIARFIEKRQPLSTINQIKIGVLSVGLDDGTFWNPCGGEQCYFKYDAEHPGQQLKLPNPKLIPFPGNPL